LGEASVRRIYGDFSRPQMSGWQGQAAHARSGAASPARQYGGQEFFRYRAGDRCHGPAAFGRFDGFVLVSSDSDFTRLASRIREQGLDVYGIGQQKTPEAFRKACKRFIFVENILPEQSQTRRRKAGRKKAAPAKGGAADQGRDGAYRQG
jgi:hypothetical protein